MGEMEIRRDSCVPGTAGMIHANYSASEYKWTEIIGLIRSQTPIQFRNNQNPTP